MAPDSGTRHHCNQHQISAATGELSAVAVDDVVVDTWALAPRLYDGNNDAVALLTVALSTAPRMFLKRVTHYKLDVTVDCAADRLLLYPRISTNKTKQRCIAYSPHPAPLAQRTRLVLVPRTECNYFHTTVTAARLTQHCSDSQTYAAFPLTTVSWIWQGRVGGTKSRLSSRLYHRHLKLCIALPCKYVKKFHLVFSTTIKCDISWPITTKFSDKMVIISSCHCVTAIHHHVATYFKTRCPTLHHCQHKATV